MKKSEIELIFSVVSQLDEMKSKLISLLPDHNFEEVYDSLPGVAGWRCRCGRWSGTWLGEKCDGSEVPLPPGKSYEKRVK